jgi:hypothetical protein
LHVWWNKYDAPLKNIVFIYDIIYWFIILRWCPICQVFYKFLKVVLRFIRYLYCMYVWEVMIISVCTSDRLIFRMVVSCLLTIPHHNGIIRINIYDNYDIDEVPNL